ncbi:hypothetical protein ACJIZ3_015236 [Penstemon smallii]|uniref:Cytochrome P450 n=1 Tax=Penstemon smallii TaxID=265156 RepID=A0ABD3RM44_9LAMI
MQMFSSFELSSSIVPLIIIIFYYYIYKWRNPKCTNGKLPPGSSGIPFIGETLELIIPSYTYDINPFLQKRLQRHGLLFRTNLAGHNMVVSADQEFNHFIFRQEEKLVVQWYMDVIEKLFKKGQSSPGDGQSIHKYMRNLILSHFGVDCLKQKLLPQFEQLVQTTLKSWSIQHSSIELKSASVAMFGEFAAKQLFSYDLSNSKHLLTDKFVSFSNGLMSMPLNIPGTWYHKCLKDKEKVVKIIRDIVKERKEKKNNSIKDDDLLGRMIQDMKNYNFLTEELITQLLFGFLFASFESVPSQLLFALKFISENPNVLHQLTAENEEILKRRKTLDSSFTWEDYKSMTFTLQVVNETLRLSNVMPGFLRKAVKDIQVNGYTIPAGWGIMVCQSVVHLDPNTYKDPLKFNPWRWKDVNSEFISKNLKPFGGGIKQCAGADFSRATMCVFLHVLVTKYKNWSIVKGGDIVQSPLLHFKNGLHITLSDENPN